MRCHAKVASAIPQTQSATIAHTWISLFSSFLRITPSLPAWRRKHHDFFVTQRYKAGFILLVPQLPYSTKRS